MTALFDHVRDVGIVIHQRSAIVDDHQVKVERMEKSKVSSIVTKVEAWATELTHRSEDAEQYNNCVMEDELLQLTQGLDIVKAHSSGIAKEVVATIERA